MRRFRRRWPVRERRPIGVALRCIGMQADANGQVLMHTRDDFSVEYAGVRKVLEVEPAGRPTKVSDNIEKLVLIRRGTRAELAKRGSVLVASIQGKKKTFQIDGQTVDPESAKALELVVDIS